MMYRNNDGRRLHKVLRYVGVHLHSCRATLEVGDLLELGIGKAG